MSGIRTRIRKGLGKIEFVSCLDRILAMEKQGYGPVLMYETLRQDNLLTMTYGGFYSAIRKLRLHGPERPRLAAGRAEELRRRAAEKKTLFSASEEVPLLPDPAGKSPAELMHGVRQKRESRQLEKAQGRGTTGSDNITRSKTEDVVRPDEPGDRS